MTDRKAFPLAVVKNNAVVCVMICAASPQFAENKALSSQSRSEGFNVVNYLHPVNHAVAIGAERSVIVFWVGRNDQPLKLRNRDEVMNLNKILTQFAIS